MQAASEPGGPSFLSLPERPPKPRTAGLTHVLDKGLPLGSFESVLDAVGAFIDVWKFGYGLAYLDHQLDAKLALLDGADVKACPGGTLAEICAVQHRTTEYLDWLGAHGFRCVEISNGASGIPIDTKRDLIAVAADRGFEVFSEVGSKDPASIVTAEAWAAEAKGDLEAGARWIVAEGRESGTVGLYDADGEIRSALVDALEAIGPEAQVIYEAPRRPQQAWLIRHLGPNVGLGNVSVEEVSSVEALRRGLRTDTMMWSSSLAGDQCST